MEIVFTFELILTTKIVKNCSFRSPKLRNFDFRAFNWSRADFLGGQELYRTIWVYFETLGVGGYAFLKS